jgi:hypothetical protein
MGKFDHYLVKDAPVAADAKFAKYLVPDVVPLSPDEARAKRVSDLKASNPERFAALQAKSDQYGKNVEALKAEGLRKGITDINGQPEDMDILTPLKRGEYLDAALAAHRAGSSMATAAKDDLTEVAADPKRAIKSAAASAVNAAFPGGIRANLGGLMREPFDFETPEMSAQREANAAKVSSAIESTAAAGPRTAQIVGGAVGSLSPVNIGGVVGGAAAKATGAALAGREIAPTLVNAAKGAIGAGTGSAAASVEGAAAQGKTLSLSDMGEAFVRGAGPAAGAGLIGSAAIGGAQRRATRDLMQDLRRSDSGYVVPTKMKGIAENASDYFDLLKSKKELRGIQRMPAEDAVDIVKKAKTVEAAPLDPAYEIMDGVPKAKPDMIFRETAEDWMHALKMREKQIRENRVKVKAETGVDANATALSNLEEAQADLRDLATDHNGVVDMNRHVPLSAIRRLHGEKSAATLRAPGQLMGTEASRRANGIKQEWKAILTEELQDRAAASPDAAEAFKVIEKHNKPVAMLSRLEDALKFKAEKEAQNITRRDDAKTVGKVGLLGGLSALASGNTGAAALGLGTAAALAGYGVTTKAGRRFSAAVLGPIEQAIERGEKWSDVSSWAVPAGAGIGMTDEQTKRLYDKVSSVKAKPKP